MAITYGNGCRCSVCESWECFRGFGRTGSNPPFDNGWQRSSRHKDIHPPRTMPNSLTAIAAYSEQVG
jgi:hypothetical protein